MVARPLKRALLLLVSSFIGNNWKIDDSSSRLFKEGGMELSLLLYCIPFVYSGQCSPLYQPEMHGTPYRYN